MTTQTSDTSTIDTSIPKDYVFDASSTSSLPSSLEVIPAGVSSLAECAQWQIEQLETTITTASAALTTEVEDALDDGFVLCDLNVVANKLKAWRGLFPRVKPFFALKCHPDPMVASVLGNTSTGMCASAGFDCASLSEIQLALQSTGNNPQLIVYANPQRAETDLEASLQLGVTAFTVDGPQELYKIHNAYQKISIQLCKPPQIIIRLLVPDEHSSVPLGEKFGAVPDPTTIEQLTQIAMTLNLPVIGVSFHCGSGCHDPQAYVQAIQLAHTAMQVISKTTNTKCWLLDIGGGYPGRDGASGDLGRFCGTPTNHHNNNNATNDTASLETAAKIAHAINPLLDELFPPSDTNVQIISEPGRYFVEAAFALCSRIYRVHQDNNDNNNDTTPRYTIAQGVQGVFKDVVLCGETFHPIPLQLQRPDTTNTTTTTTPSIVQGPSGDEICRMDLPVSLQVGDWLLFDRMGAYTLSIAARSGRPPIRYVLGGQHP